MDFDCLLYIKIRNTPPVPSKAYSLIENWKTYVRDSCVSFSVEQRSQEVKEHLMFRIRWVDEKKNPFLHMHPRGFLPGCFLGRLCDLTDIRLRSKVKVVCWFLRKLEDVGKLTWIATLSNSITKVTFKKRK